MIDIKYLREHPEAFKERIDTRGQSFDIASFALLDEKRRASIKQVEQLSLIHISEPTRPY